MAERIIKIMLKHLKAGKINKLNAPNKNKEMLIKMLLNRITHPFIIG